MSSLTQVYGFGLLVHVDDPDEREELKYHLDQITKNTPYECGVMGYKGDFGNLFILIKSYTKAEYFIVSSHVKQGSDKEIAALLKFVIDHDIDTDTRPKGFFYPTAL